MYVACLETFSLTICTRNCNIWCCVAQCQQQDSELQQQVLAVIRMLLRFGADVNACSQVRRMALL